ncbi:MAG: diacylglycerol kinase [Desulfobulbaceae bacterium]
METGSKASGQGLMRVWRAFGWSMSGFRAVLRNEAAFRQEAALCAVLAPLALWLGGSGVERALLVGSLVLVLVVELLNSAIEAVVDRIGTEHHELSGRAKDIGSAAVFTSLVNVLAVWLLVLLPHWL